MFFQTLQHIPPSLVRQREAAEAEQVEHEKAEAEKKQALQATAVASSKAGRRKPLKLPGGMSMSTQNLATNAAAGGDSGVEMPVFKTPQKSISIISARSAEESTDDEKQQLSVMPNPA